MKSSTAGKLVRSATQEMLQLEDAEKKVRAMVEKQKEEDEVDQISSFLARYCSQNSTIPEGNEEILQNEGIREELPCCTCRVQRENI